jgi:hypothetical protein
MNADVRISPHGSILLFDLLTPDAESWVEEHVDPDAQWFGGALAVEHRYAADLAVAIHADGLRVEVV